MSIAFDDTTKKFTVVRGSDALDVFHTNSRSMTLWLRINSAPSQDVHLIHAIQSGYADGGGSAEAEFGVYYDQSLGKLRTRTSTATGGGSSDLPWPDTITLGQWYLLTIRRTSSGVMRCYLDGSDTVQSSSSSAQTPDAQLVEMLIGRSFDAAGSPESETLDCEVAVVGSWDGDIGLPTTHGIYAESSRTPTSTGEALTALFDFENDAVDSVGSATCECLSRFDFVDDSDQFGSYTAPFTTVQLIRSSLASKLINNSSANVVFCGDSFASDESTARLPLPVINALGNTPAGLIRDAKASFNTHPVATAVSQSGSDITITDIESANGYDIEGDGVGTPGHYALPTTLQQQTLGPSASSSLAVFRVSTQSPSSFSGTPLNDFTETASGFLARMIFKAPTSAADQWDNFYTRDFGDVTSDTPQDFSGIVAGESFVSSEMLIDSQGAGNSQYMFLHEDTGATPANKLLTLQGSRWLRSANGTTLDPGLVWSFLDDNSWSYSGFGQDATSDGGANLKRFSDDEYESWYGAAFTGLASRTPLIVVHLATEGSDLASAQSDLEAIVTRFDARHASLGTPSPEYLFIMPGMHAVGSVDLPGDRLQAERYSEAAYNVAAVNSRVSYYSLYHATDGAAFWPAAELPYGALASTDSPRVWLAGYDSDNGTSYDSTTSGIMRDSSALHLADSTSAEFEAEVLANEMLRQAGGPRQRLRRRGRKRDFLWR